ncbi:hypothetical protein SAMN05421786_102578 [Chryseobacterium ureilyticum]|uniref:Uncharacterized protein n=1 Tax=Chryseobacterium ureilyticum TaxID=373668 RepID=A0A1N7MGP5_9FLAO|nr:hypothetical protein SAMN05421786_102578 [Chryseobacterium ureilyticum]
MLKFSLELLFIVCFFNLYNDLLVIFHAIERFVLSFGNGWFIFVRLIQIFDRNYEENLYILLFSLFVHNVSCTMGSNSF